MHKVDDLWWYGLLPLSLKRGGVVVGATKISWKKFFVFANSVKMKNQIELVQRHRRIVKWAFQ